jgi:hypothetical protein
MSKEQGPTQTKPPFKSAYSETRRPQEVTVTNTDEQETPTDDLYLTTSHDEGSGILGLSI